MGGRGWRRFLLGLVLAYLAGYAVEVLLGNWDPWRVGWSASYLPVFVEGAVFGFTVRGIWGALFAPLPIALAPETWARLQHLLELVGPAGLALLVQPLPVMWLGGMAGSLVRRLLRRWMFR
jgi:hypothetical protein